MPPDENEQAVAEHSALPAGLSPLLVNADVAGPLCGRSPTSWWRDHAAGRVPRPVKLGGATLWRVAELQAWVSAGCPQRKEWEQRQGAGDRGRAARA